MADMRVAGVVAKIMKEEGVEWYAGVHGGHVWALMASVAMAGIKMYHMRHEQSGAYAADGWARVTKKPGVCFGTAGPGFGNMVSGLYHAYLTRSPVVALLGQHGTNEDFFGPFQEAYAEKITGPFTKWTKRIVDPSTAGFMLQKAFRDATSYPMGPVALELPTNIQGAPVGDMMPGYLPPGACCNPTPPAGDPKMVEKAVKLLLKAKKPVIVAGDGVFWSDGAKDLRKFVELMQIPVQTRRMGRGAVPEDHPLAIGGGFRRPIFAQADVIAIFGLRMNMLESFGMPPTYPCEKVKYIQVAQDWEELTTRMPATISIVGAPGPVLKQMIDCAKDMMKVKGKTVKTDRSEWVATIAAAKAKAQAKVKAKVDKVRNNKEMHPDFIAAELFDFLDRDATIILDSFSFAGFSTDKIQATFAGQILDTSTWGGVGHSVGMAMGAQLGRPGKQVVALIGDGGLGVSGWDIETLARNKIPACFFLYNNSSWMGDIAQKEIMPMVKDTWGMIPGIRYDKIFAEMGCHTEHVTEGKELKPALERAFNSGTTSVIDVVPDLSVLAPQLSARIEFYKKLFGG